MSDRVFEHAVSDWLEAGSDRTPPAAIDAVLLAVKTTPQQRDLRIPRRFTLMTTPMRLAALIAGVAIAGVAALALPNRGPGLGPSGTSTPLPTTSPAPTGATTTAPSPTTDPNDTSAWTVYTSDRYGFTLGHPAGWSEVPATRAWSYEDDGANFLTPAADAFRSAEGDVRVSAWVVPFEQGAEPEQTWAAVEAWIEAYCPKTDITSCGVIQERAEPLCVEVRDCHPGLLVPFDDSVQAFFFGGVAVAGGMTVVSVWWPDGASETARYGGAKRLLEAFIGTMNVWPELRRPSPQDAIWPPP